VAASKKKIFIDLIVASLIIAGLTFLAPYWYRLFGGLAARIAAILSFQVILALIVIILNFAEREKLSSLGFKRGGLSSQIIAGTSVFVVLSVVFIGAPLLFGIKLQDLLPSKDGSVAFFYNLLPLLRRIFGRNNIQGLLFFPHN
jgi:hypothetical protein